jgi:hypothetical protein
MGWNPFKAIQRAFTPPAPVRQFISNATKITGESFQPAEIFRVAGAASQTLYTGGLSLLNPKVGNTTIVSSDPNKASVVGAAIVGANSFGTVQAGNPDVKESTLNQIARKIGGAISAIAVGSAGANVLTTPANALPAGVQGPTQPLTFGQQFGNFGATITSSSAVAYGSGNIAQTVIGIFGKKVGGAILQLFSGDVAGAVKTITTPTPETPTIALPPNLFGNYQSGGGGGSGLGVGTNSGQLTSNPLIFPVMGIAALFVVWLIVRKK